MDDRISTEELVKELIKRGAKLHTNVLYGDTEIIIKSKYSENRDFKVLENVLDVSDLIWFFIKVPYVIKCWQYYAGSSFWF